MSQLVVSRTIQSYLRVLATQSSHWAALRLFHGLPTAVAGRICIDAHVPVLATPAGDHRCECDLVMQVSFFQCGSYHRDVLHFESDYDPGEVLELGPARWNQLADTQAYQLINELFQWRKTRGMVAFIFLEASTGLLPNRQRFYL